MGGVRSRPTRWAVPPWAAHSAAVAALCGLALLTAAVARAGTVERGVAGAVVARGDLGGPVLVTVVAAAAVRAWSQAGVTWVGWLWRSALVAYPVWWVALGFAHVTAERRSGSGELLVNAVLLRSPDGTPLAGMGGGWIVCAGALAWALAPGWARLGRGRVLVLVLAVALSWAVRIGAAAVDDAAASGWRSLAVADLAVLGYLSATWRPTRRAGASIAAGAALAAVLVVAVSGLPRAGSPVDGTVEHLALAAAGVLLAATVVTLLALAASAQRVGWAVTGLALAAPGLVLTHEVVVNTLAARYRERAVIAADGTTYVTGTVLPLWCWCAITAAAAGVLLTAAVANPAWRLAARRWWPGQYMLAAAGVTAMAFAIRLGTLLRMAPERTDAGDPQFYHITANLLARGRGFYEPVRWMVFGRVIQSAMHAPLYPVVLSLSSRIGGTAWFDHKLVSVLIGTALVVVVGVLARRLAGRAVALVAMALAAIYPNLWVIDGVLFPEGLFALLTMVCTLCAYAWYDHPRYAVAATLGAGIALLALTRGEGILLAPFLVVPWMLRKRGLPLRTRWSHLIVTGAATVAVLMPWWIHNLSRFGPFVPLSTNGNELYVYANCDDVYGGPLFGYWQFGCQEEIRAERRAQGLPPDPIVDEAERAIWWRDQGLDYARAHLDEVPKVILARVGRQWELYRPWQMTYFMQAEGRHGRATQSGLIMYYFLAAASVAGLVALRRRKVRLLPLTVQFLTVTLTAAFAYGTVRFRAPAEPVLCLLAAVGLVALVRALRTRLSDNPRKGDDDAVRDHAAAVADPEPAAP